MDEEQTLSSLEPGQKGTILRVNGSGAARRRLIDMGMTRGTRVELIGKAPFGDPLDFMVRGYHLSLRKQESDTIIVTIESD